MRVVAVRPDGLEFRVASEEFGGGKPQKSKASVKAISADGTEFELPLGTDQSQSTDVKCLYFLPTFLTVLP